ncbi:MAG: STAS/SEC14 domain-containing protein [Bacteroidetes bacterium]|nr:STAS/SEC14 domain-containing protein [Bacteroidota bacterium]
MENYEELVDDMWIEDEILYITCKHEHNTEQIVEANIKHRLAITKGKSYLIFADTRKIKSYTREARQRLAQKDAGFGTIAAALYTDSVIHEIIFNFFNVIYKAPAPSKTFTDREKALKWLKQFKEKNNNEQ